MRRCAAAWCSQRRPRAFRRRRRAYLAACKLALMLTTAAVAATQHSRLSRPATRYWQCIMFALLYGRGLFLGMSTLFLQARPAARAATHAARPWSSLRRGAQMLTRTVCAGLSVMGRAVCEPSTRRIRQRSCPGRACVCLSGITPSALGERFWFLTARVWRRAGSCRRRS